MHTQSHTHRALACSATMTGILDVSLLPPAPAAAPPERPCFGDGMFTSLHLSHTHSAKPPAVPPLSLYNLIYLSLMSMLIHPTLFTVQRCINPSLRCVRRVCHKVVYDPKLPNLSNSLYHRSSISVTLRSKTAPIIQFDCTAHLPLTTRQLVVAYTHREQADCSYLDNTRERS